MNRKHLLDIAVILVWFTLLALTSQFAFEGSKGSRILNAVRVGSVMILIMSLYLTVISWVRGRGQSNPVKHDRLSLWNIITHAYLMGAFIFVAMYCLLGESRDATKTFFISLSIVSVEDVFVRTADKTLRRSMLFFTTLLSIISVTTIQGPSEALEAFVEQRWFAIVFGWILPCVVPIFFTLIRKKRFYSTVTVLEFLHFGMPFAAMLACLSLVSIDLVKHNYENNTEAYVDYPHRRSLNVSMAVPWNHSALVHQSTSLINLSSYHPLANLTGGGKNDNVAEVAIPLLSVLMLPMVCSIIDKCLLYCTVDVLCVASVVWAFKSLRENNGLPGALYVVSFLSASVGFCFRIYVCSMDENDYTGVAYTKELEDEEEEEQMIRSMQRDIGQISMDA